MKNIRSYIKSLNINKNILNYDELIKKGINSNIIFIKKIVETTPNIFDMINNIYTINATYKIIFFQYIVFFEKKIIL